MLYVDSPPPMAPLTLLFKVYQRNQVNNRADTNRYCTTFFWGNRGDFVWHPSNYIDSFVGVHPYPGGTGGTPNPPADLLTWEISAHAQDATLRDNGTRPEVLYNQWYSQAVRVQNTGGNNHEYKAWLNLPNVTTQWTITETINAPLFTPTTPSLMFGQAPKSSGDPNKSWGGYDGWEEQNAIIRAVSAYASAVSETDILSLTAANTDMARASVESGLGLTAWYRNMNWTLSDVTDKSGSGHHLSWDGASRPALYSA